MNLLYNSCSIHWNVVLMYNISSAEMGGNHSSIQSEFEKIRTRKTPNTDTFHAVNALVIYMFFILLCFSLLLFYFIYLFIYLFIYFCFLVTIFVINICLHLYLCFLCKLLRLYFIQYLHFFESKVNKNSNKKKVCIGK